MNTEIYRLLPQLKAHIKADLNLQPTSIEQLHRMSNELGIHLLAKRDDTGSLAMGGNKVRQLEYYLGPAMQGNTDTVLITGAIQSNFVRLCAAAAAKLSWRAVVQLEKRVSNDSASYNESGNVLLNHLLGAQIHYFDGGGDEVAADANLDKLADAQRAQGYNPYVVHLGINHPPLGGLGYAQCAVECFLQLKASRQMPDHVVIPSGSGLTHAGFLVGARAIGWAVPVHGVCVRRDASLQQKRISLRVNEINQMLSGAASITSNDVVVSDSVLAPGYGQMNQQVTDALTVSARLEALLLDPVYSGRTMAGLIDLVDRGVIAQGESVLFIHTGGLPGIFAYQDDLMRGIGAL
ncbi:MAG: D-cysteine desulfhydrase family protein [Granulosicoccaceae bacterium]